MPQRQTLEHLLTTLVPRRTGEFTFSASNTHPEGFRLYGGQVLAQALQAAAETVDSDRRVHSQHAYFLRPGDPTEEVLLEVENARDGRSFSSRRVVALQKGKPILVSSLSFQVPGEGDEFQSAMPSVPGPETLITERERELASDTFYPEFQITTGLDLDVRLVEPVDWQNPQPRDPVLYAWMKTTGPVAPAPGKHESVLVYMSDSLLIDVALAIHGRHYKDGMSTASLDHAMWFHAPCAVDEWLLFVTEGQRVGGGRGLSRGQFYSTDGTLIATCMQEAMMRKTA